MSDWAWHALSRSWLLSCLAQSPQTAYLGFFFFNIYSRGCSSPASVEMSVQLQFTMYRSQKIHVDIPLEIVSFTHVQALLQHLHFLWRHRDVHIIQHSAIKIIVMLQVRHITSSITDTQAFPLVSHVMQGPSPGECAHCCSTQTSSHFAFLFRGSYLARAAKPVLTVYTREPHQSTTARWWPDILVQP